MNPLHRPDSSYAVTYCMVLYLRHRGKSTHRISIISRFILMLYTRNVESVVRTNDTHNGETTMTTTIRVFTMTGNAAKFAFRRPGQAAPPSMYWTLAGTVRLSLDGLVWGTPRCDWKCERAWLTR